MPATKHDVKTKSQIPGPVQKGMKPKTGTAGVKSKTKVRNVPDFDKLHRQWATKLEKGKAYTKKPCTQVHEFGITNSGTTFTRAETKNTNDVVTATRVCHQTAPKSITTSTNQKCNVEFEPDGKALNTIFRNRGLAASQMTGRATIAGSSCASRRQPIPQPVSKPAQVKPPSPVEQNVKDTRVLPTEVPSESKDIAGPSAAKNQSAEFAADSKSLQSILTNTGIVAPTDHDVAPSRGLAQRLTIAGGAERIPTPLGLRHHPRLTMSARKSIYYTGRCADGAPPMNVYSEQARRVISRMTLDGVAEHSPTLLHRATPMHRLSPAPNEIQSPYKGPIAFKQKGSAYPVYVHPEDLCVKDGDTNQSTAWRQTPRTNQKAQRIPLKSASRAQAMRVSPQVRCVEPMLKSEVRASSKKWKDILGPTAVGDHTNIAKEAEDDKEPLARVLDFEGNEDEAASRSVTSQLATSDTTSDLHLKVELQHLQHIEELEKELLADIAKMEEGPDSRNKSHFFPTPETPVAKITNDRPKSEVIIKGRGSRSPSTALQKLALAPLALQQTKETKKLFPSPSLGTQATSIQIWRDEGNSVKSSKKICKGQLKDSVDSNRLSPKPSPLKLLSPNVKHDEYKSPKSPKSGSKKLQSFRLAVPEHNMSLPKKSVWFEQKENLSGKDDLLVLKEDLHNCTIEDLNSTLCESVLQFEKLETTADRLRCEQPTSSEKILKQLEVIQRKQTKLVKLQETLQRQLLVQLEGAGRKSAEMGNSGHSIQVAKRVYSPQLHPELREENAAQVSTSTSSQPAKVEIKKHVTPSPRLETQSNSQPEQFRKPPACWEAVEEKSTKVSKLMPSSSKKSPKSHQETAATSQDSLIAKVDFSSESNSKVTPGKTSPRKSAFSRRSGPGFVLPASDRTALTSAETRDGAVDLSLKKSPLQERIEQTAKSERKTNNVSSDSTVCVTPKMNRTAKGQSSDTPVVAPFSPNLTLAGSGQIVHGYVQDLHRYFSSSSVEKLAMQKTGRCLLEPSLGVVGGSVHERTDSTLSIDDCTSSSSTESTPLDLSLKKHEGPTPGSASPVLKSILKNSASKASSEPGNPGSSTSTNFNNNCPPGNSATPCNCNAAPAPFTSVRNKLQFSPSPSDNLALSSGLSSVTASVNKSPQKGLKSNMIRMAAQRFYDALLDEEVSLYACRLHPRAGVNCGAEGRCDNPIALLLAEGDEKHFVPIKMLTPSSPMKGSAFTPFRGS